MVIMILMTITIINLINMTRMMTTTTKMGYRHTFEIIMLIERVMIKILFMRTKTISIMRTTKMATTDQDKDKPDTRSSLGRV